MDYKSLAEEALTKSNYADHYNYIKEYHKNVNNEESQFLIKKALKMCNTYEGLKEFLKTPENKYYAILKCTKDDTDSKIRSNYTSLLAKFHPNLTHVKECTEAVRIIKAAYDKISTADKRRALDRHAMFEAANTSTMSYERGDLVEEFIRMMQGREDVFMRDFVGVRMYNRRFGTPFRVRRVEGNEGSIRMILLFIILSVLSLFLY